MNIIGYALGAALALGVAIVMIDFLIELIKKGERNDE